MLIYKLSIIGCLKVNNNSYLFHVIYVDLFYQAQAPI